jgi:hypothetical protein
VSPVERFLGCIAANQDEYHRYVKAQIGYREANAIYEFGGSHFLSKPEKRKRRRQLLRARLELETARKIWTRINRQWQTTT